MINFLRISTRTTAGRPEVDWEGIALFIGVAGLAIADEVSVSRCCDALWCRYGSLFFGRPSETALAQLEITHGGESNGFLKSPKKEIGRPSRRVDWFSLNQFTTEA